MSDAERSFTPVRLRPDPEHDPVGTVRVHPDHDPRDPRASRMIRTNTGTDQFAPWSNLTSPVPGLGWANHDYVDDWPVQPWWHLAVVLDEDLDELRFLEEHYAAGRRIETGRTLVGSDVEHHTELIRANAFNAECAAAWHRGRLDEHLELQRRGARPPSPTPAVPIAPDAPADDEPDDGPPRFPGETWTAHEITEPTVDPESGETITPGWYVLGQADHSEEHAFASMHIGFCWDAAGRDVTGEVARRAAAALNAATAER